MTNLNNCSFYGIKWEGEALKTVQTVAEALKINAKALQGLVGVFQGQNIQIDTLVKIETGNSPGLIYIPQESDLDEDESTDEQVDVAGSDPTTD